EAEDGIDMGVRVGVVVGTAADEIGAPREGTAEERFRARRLENSLLSEGAELEVERRRVLLLEGQERLEPLELDDGIHLDVATHDRGAVQDGEIEHPSRARADVLDGEAALRESGDPDRLGERSLHARRAIDEERLVQ